MLALWQHIRECNPPQPPHPIRSYIPPPPSAILSPFSIDASTWLIMRHWLLYYLSNGCAIKYPCKWPMPHFVLIYGILIEFVSANWKILLFNVCIAVVAQACFNETVSLWPCAGKGVSLSPWFGSGGGGFRGGRAEVMVLGWVQKRSPKIKNNLSYE